MAALTLAALAASAVRRERRCAAIRRAMELTGSSFMPAPFAAGIRSATHYARDRERVRRLSRLGVLSSSAVRYRGSGPLASPATRRPAIIGPGRRWRISRPTYFSDTPSETAAYLDVCDVCNGPSM
jgi:hypothetical protein